MKCQYINFCVEELRAKCPENPKECLFYEDCRKRYIEYRKKIDKLLPWEEDLLFGGDK